MANYLLTLTEPQDEYPVSLDEVKADLKIEHDDEDDLLEGLIADACAFVGGPDGVTGKALLYQKWTLAIPCVGSSDRIYLSVTPVQSVESITYYDVDNAQQSLDVDDFYLYRHDDWAYLEPKPNVTWPGVYDRLDAITVTFIAGYEDAEFVPGNIKRAIRLLVVHWYRNRGAVNIGNIVTEIPLGVQAALSISRKGWVG